MIKLLLTAFEPFGENTFNITEKVLNRISTICDGCELYKCLLPVSYSRAPVVLQETIACVQPDAVLLLGQCAEGEKIRLERFALNMMDAKKSDNDGISLMEQNIYPYAPLALQTEFPLHTVKENCSSSPVPLVISNSAGLYVCNRAYYEALYRNQKALFVHIPKNIDEESSTETILQIAQCIARHFILIL